MLLIYKIIPSTISREKTYNALILIFSEEVLSSFLNIFIHLWLCWGLRCFLLRPSLVATEQGLLFIVVHRLLTEVASLVAEHRL